MAVFLTGMPLHVKVSSLRQRGGSLNTVRLEAPLYSRRSENLLDSMEEVVVDVFQHLGDSQKVLMRVLLARGVDVEHVGHLRPEKIIRIGVHWVASLVLVHGSIEICNDSLRKCMGACRIRCLYTGPVTQRQSPESAKDAVVSWCVTSVLAAKIVEELWNVEQALERCIPVAKKSRVIQPFGPGVDFPDRPPRSNDLPAFANASISDIPKMSKRRRHGCGSG